MELEVAVPLPPVDFHFDSTSSSPFVSAPSSPPHFPSLFFSAPTSPTRLPACVHHFPTPSSALPTSTSPASDAQEEGLNGANKDFEFDFSGHLQRTSLSADELFDGGKIRPLKPPSPPPPSQSRNKVDSPASNVASLRTTRRISQGKKIDQEKRDSDFNFGFDLNFDFRETRKGREEEEEDVKKQRRGRSGRATSFSVLSSNSGRKGSRSMSPFRASVSDYLDDVVEDFSETAKGRVSSSTSNPKSSSNYSSFLSSISLKGYRKWRLKDFLLFRSASEGRATGKDPLRKYAVLSKTAAAAEEEARNCSFRSTESSGSVSRRRGPVSAHELHYTVNRAASEEMKKKTFLPYKQLGPLGCLGFNPGLHDVSRGIGSLTRGS